MSRARNLANLGNKSTIIGINTTNRVGIGSTIPDTKLDVDGVVTATSFSGSGSGLTGLANTAFINATQLNVIGVTTVGSAVTINSTGIDAVSGVITASSFVGNVTGNASGTAGGLTGSPSINVTNITASGTLTYEDVTNVDSIGIVTARSGIEFGAAGVGGTITAVGNAEFAGIATVGGDVSIADKIIHTGDTNTALRFPSADTITAETNGSERVRIDSSGRLLVGGSSADQQGTGALIQAAATGSQGAIILNRYSNTAGGPYTYFFKSRSASLDGQTIVQDGDDLGTVIFGGSDGTDYTHAAHITSQVDGTPGNNDMPGRLVFKTTADGGTSPTERLRITSAGKLQVTGGRAGILQPEDADTLEIYTKNTDNSINRGSGITFYNHDNSGYEMGGTIQVAKENGTADDTAGYMRFCTRPAGAAAQERLRITSSGVVKVVGITSTASLTVGPGIIQEKFYNQGSALTGTYNHDLDADGMVLYAYANASASFILNVRGDASTTLNSLMHIGQTSVFTAYTGSNNTSYYMTDFKIDGASQTEKWNGGTAPTAGTGSGVDVYTFNILKTADATFVVYATFSNFA